MEIRRDTRRHAAKVFWSPLQPSSETDTPAGTLAQSFDLSTYASRQRLAAGIALALRHHLVDKSTGTRQTNWNNLRYWSRFLDEHDPAREAVRSVRDIETATLRAYIAWLDGQRLAVGTRDHAWSCLRRLLAWTCRHRPDLVQPELELPVKAFPRRNQQSRPRKALTRAELDAVLQACRQEIEASWADFETGRALLAAADRPAIAFAALSDLDFGDLGVLLALLVERYGGRIPGENWSGGKDKGLWRVLRAVQRHGGLTRVSRFLHATPATLLPYVIAIGAQLFANPDALRNLRRDCMVEHVVFEGRWLVTWDKGRARRPQRRSFLRDRGLSVPNLIDRVRALTAPLLQHAPADEREKLLLCSNLRGQRRVGLIDGNHLAELVSEFSRQQGLLGADGAPLALTLALLRPTGLALAHAALGYDVAKTQPLAGHASMDTTRRYVDQPAVRAAQAVGFARLQGRFVEVVRGGGRAAGTGKQAEPGAAPACA